ncbi:MEDS domain-containing protein [Actinomadura sp. 9N407]|uniref:MEDS domain-containing protein n=1 Tax=Actinomadura sp. 9N407 TaxID=3375154 RepID=UPI00378D31D7
METLWSVRRPVCELRPGDHAWLAYGSQEEQHHVAGAFIRAGLAAGEKVIYLAGAAPVTVPRLPAHELLNVVSLDRAERHADHSTGHSTGHRAGHFDPGALVRTVAEAIGRAEDQGHRGIRIATDMTWAVRRPSGLELLLGCERRIDQAIGPSTRAIALCQFDRSRCTAAELEALGESHGVAVAPDPLFEDSVLLIERMFKPLGLALVGELDASRHAVLVQALSTVTADAVDREVHLDLAGLGFIDLGALNILADAAARTAGCGALVLDRMSPQLRTVMETVGWHMLPGLRLGPDRPSP